MTVRVGPAALVAVAALIIVLPFGLLYAYRNQTPGTLPVFPVGLAVLSVAVTFLIPALVIWALVRARAPDPYERLERIANLRDRGVLSEEEFQREKQRVIK